MKSTSILLI